MARFQHRREAKSSPKTPIIIPRADHTISRTHVSPAALKVLYRLKDAGFSAYLVGGSIRDLLAGIEPKDFDVATNAHPEEVRQLFRNSRIIGRRFRLVHVCFGDEIIEVTTFRGATTTQTKDRYHTEHGVLARDNVYGTLADDVLRRDFTVNALYYNIYDFSLVDYTGGLKDLTAKLIRIIGDPQQRYQEDPLRMLRAIRLAAKLDFNIHPETAAPIYQLQDSLQHVHPARLFEEILKCYFSGYAQRSFSLLQDYQLFAILFPQTSQALQEDDAFNRLFTTMLQEADTRIKDGRSLNPGFLFAVLLWGPLQKLINAAQEQVLLPQITTFIHEVIHEQTRVIAIPQRFTHIVKEIWLLQYRLLAKHPNNLLKAFYHPRFRAAYDFLLLRGRAGEPVQEKCNWWQQFQTVDEKQQLKMLTILRSKKRRRRNKN